MSKFAAFMAGGAERIENKKVAISSRFKNEDGTVAEWELKALTANENELLQKQCMINVPVPGRKGQFSRELDQTKYTGMLLAASVVIPDLNDAELQNSYGVYGSSELLSKMLYMQEYNKLAEEVSTLTPGEGLVDKVDKAKN